MRYHIKDLLFQCGLTSIEARVVVRPLLGREDHR
jgi:hypothetical protein